MSFSIPAAEDIGPRASEPFDGAPLEPSGGLTVGGNNLNSDFASAAAAAAANDRTMMKWNGKTAQKRRLGGPVHMAELADSNQLAGQAAPAPPNIQQQLAEFPRPPGQTRPAQLGAAGGEKRDVISVGQCCNMMETEDVSVAPSASMHGFGLRQPIQ